MAEYNWEAIFTAANMEPQKEPTAPASVESIVMLPVEELADHPSYAQGAPFRAASEDRIKHMSESIRRSGILSPLLVRPFEGHYQIIGGHCRKRAAMRCGYQELPCIVKDVDDDAVIDLLLTDNLLQRLDTLLPSEKGRAYRLWLERMNRQGEQTTLHLVDLERSTQEFGITSSADSKKAGQKLNSPWNSKELLSRIVGEGQTQIQRYVRLTYLISGLLELTDAQKIGLQTAVELSYLCRPTQELLLEYLNSGKHGISKAQALELRKLDADLSRQPDAEAIAALLEVPVQRAARILKLQLKPIRSFFPPDAGQEEMQETIQKALEYYCKKQKENVP